MKAIKATDVQVREINRLWLRRSISADYVHADGSTHYGLLVAVRRQDGKLCGKLKASGRWVPIKTIYIKR